MPKVWTARVISFVAVAVAAAIAIGLSWQIFRFVRDGGVHVSSGVRISVSVTERQSADVYDLLAKFAAKHRLQPSPGSMPLNAGWRSDDAELYWLFPDRRPSETGGALTVFGFEGSERWQTLAAELDGVLRSSFVLKSAELQLDPREYDCQPQCNGRAIGFPLDFKLLKLIKIDHVMPK